MRVPVFDFRYVQSAAELANELVVADKGSTALLSRYFQLHDVERMEIGGAFKSNGLGKATPIKLLYLHNRSSIWCAVAALNAVEVDVGIRKIISLRSTTEDAVGARSAAIAAAEAKLLVPEGGYGARGPPKNPPGKLLAVKQNIPADMAELGSMKQDEFLAMVPWVVKALLFARHSKNVKQAVREVLANLWLSVQLGKHQGWQGFKCKFKRSKFEIYYPFCI